MNELLLAQEISLQQPSLNEKGFRMKVRSNEKEYLDNLSLEGDQLKRNLTELDWVNRLLGGYQVLKNGIANFLKYIPLQKTITICDLGCGDGASLRYLAKWARKNNRKIKFTGIDANHHIIKLAKAITLDYPEIHYLNNNIWDESIQSQTFDIITCNLFCHHLDQNNLIKLIKQLITQARFGIIINDLHRNYIAYWSIWILSRILSCSVYFKHDAPLSVKKGFQKNELEELLTQLPEITYQIRWRWAFRYQVLIIRKNIS